VICQWLHEATAKAAGDVGIPARTANSLGAALDAIRNDTPNARILICGSLYFAGHVIRENT